MASIQAAEIFARIGIKTDQKKLDQFGQSLKEVGRGLLKTVGLTLGAAGTVMAIKKVSSSAMETAVALTQMSRKIGMSVEQLQAIQGSAVIVSNKDIQRINQANKELYKLSATGKSLGMVFGGEIVTAMAGIAKQLNNWLKNNPKVIKDIQKTAKLIAFVITLTGRLVGIAGKLITATIGLRGALLTLTGVMIALNAAFWTSPIGLITAGLIALFLIVEDIYTYSQDGDSLFGDLMKASPAFAGFINTIIQLIKDLASLFSNLADSIKIVFGFLKDTGVFDALGQAIDYKFVRPIKNAIEALTELINIEKKIISSLGGVKEMTKDILGFATMGRLPVEKIATGIKSAINHVTNSVTVNNSVTGVPERAMQKASEMTITGVDNSLKGYSASQVYAQ
jgi:hypothetical protein